MKKVRYAEMTPEEFRDTLRHAPVAYLPLGTLEWHGEHLPLGSDALQAEGFFVKLAQEVGGAVLPPLFLGPDRRIEHGGKELYGMDCGSEGTTDQRGYSPQQLAGSAYWASDKLFTQIVEATLKQLARAGFKVVVAHGHGPSTAAFRDNMERWQAQYGLRLFHCWAGKDELPTDCGIMTDHAAANETSLVMALHPGLVQMERLSEKPGEFPVGVGGRDPRTHASAELGQKAIDLNLQRMKRLLKQALEA